MNTEKPSVCLCSRVTASTARTRWAQINFTRITRDTHTGREEAHWEVRKQADCVKLYVRVQKSLNNRSEVLQPPTWTSSRWDSCWALWCLWQLPALVTKTVGKRKLLLLSRSFLKARRAAGITADPRTRTPSTSKMTPAWRTGTREKDKLFTFPPSCEEACCCPTNSKTRSIDYQ